MAMASSTIGLGPYQKTRSFEVYSRKRDRDRDKERANNYPYKVIEITPPPKSLGVRCFPPYTPYQYHSADSIMQTGVPTCEDGNENMQPFSFGQPAYNA